MLRDMSNQKYSNTNPFAHERNTNVNFNYVWDENDSNWIPMQYPLEITSANPPTAGYGAVPTPLYRTLSTNGDGTGDENVVGDYSGAEEIFYVQPSATEIYRLERMLIYFRMKKGDFKFDQYGKDQELSTGIQVRVQNDLNTIIDLTNGIPIKTFGGWIRVCFDVDPAGGNLNNDYNQDAIAGARWTFSKAGYPLRLVGSNNERLEVVVNDDFTGVEIKEHYFMVQGYIENTTP